MEYRYPLKPPPLCPPVAAVFVAYLCLELSLIAELAHPPASAPFLLSFLFFFLISLLCALHLQASTAEQVCRIQIQTLLIGPPTHRVIGTKTF